MVDLDALILSPGATLASVATALDVIGQAARVEAVRSIGASAQRRLWTLAAGAEVTLDELVPPARGGQTVRHFGRNTLPVFTRFEKRFCRALDGSGLLWGYNDGPTRTVVGPGCFVCREAPDDARGAVVIDYERVPSGRPAGWPAIRGNERGLSRFVYKGMHDFLRRVSAHVTVGRAWRHGRETDHGFVLCREG